MGTLLNAQIEPLVTILVTQRKQGLRGADGRLYDQVSGKRGGHLVVGEGISLLCM